MVKWIGSPPLFQNGRVPRTRRSSVVARTSARRPFVHGPPSTLAPISSPPMPVASTPRHSARARMARIVLVLAQLPVRPRVWMLPVQRWMPS